MNNLCRLPRVKSDIAGVGTATTNDDVYLRAIEEASREFETDCRRHFYAKIDTRYFEANHSDRRKLWVGDLLTISTLKLDLDYDTARAYEITLVDGTDYDLGPTVRDPGWPYNWVRLWENGTQLSAWPKRGRTVQVVGTFGFSYETEAIVVSGTATTGTLTTAADTTLTASVDVSAYIYPGDTLVVESEQMDVTAVSTTTVTVTRGINGTTAVAHTTAALAIRRFPREIERVVAERVVTGRWDSQGGYLMAEGGRIDRGVYARWAKAVREYRTDLVVR